MKLRNIASALVLGLVVGQNMMAIVKPSASRDNPTIMKSSSDKKFIFNNKTNDAIEVIIEKKGCNDTTYNLAANKETILYTSGSCWVSSIKLIKNGKDVLLKEIGITEKAAGTYNITKDKQGRFSLKKQ